MTTLCPTAVSGLFCHQTYIAEGTGSITLHVIEFAAERFVPEAFMQAGINCPDAIRRSVRKRQAEFFFGRLAARAAMGSLMLLDAQVLIGDQRQPIWPRGVIGSITHVDGLAMAAAEKSGKYRGIGIDVEYVLSEDACQGVLATVVDQQELDNLQVALRELSLPKALTIVFSAKEALYKAAYVSVQRFFDFSAVRVLNLDVRKKKVTFILDEALSEDFVRGQKCEVWFDFFRSDMVLTYSCW